MIIVQTPSSKPGSAVQAVKSCIQYVSVDIYGITSDALVQYLPTKLYITNIRIQDSYLVAQLIGCSATGSRTQLLTLRCSDDQPLYSCADSANYHVACIMHIKGISGISQDPPADALIQLSPHCVQVHALPHTAGYAAQAGGPVFQLIAGQGLQVGVHRQAGEQSGLSESPPELICTRQARNLFSDIRTQSGRPRVTSVNGEYAKYLVIRGSGVESQGRKVLVQCFTKSNTIQSSGSTVYVQIGSSGFRECSII